VNGAPGGVCPPPPLWSNLHLLFGAALAPLLNRGMARAPFTALWPLVLYGFELLVAPWQLHSRTCLVTPPGPGWGLRLKPSSLTSRARAQRSFTSSESRELSHPAVGWGWRFMSPQRGVADPDRRIARRATVKGTKPNRLMMPEDGSSWPLP